jgi:hypothetical protein
MAAQKMSIREQLRRANPTVDAPTYRLLTGQITEDEYKALLDDERVRHGLPRLRPDLASPAGSTKGAIHD